jgi:2,3-bisphosphoglycerate-independent phosphoglycerate mutase
MVTVKSMKYVVIIGDGMADRPLKELGGKTPLQAADKPNMDWIAANGGSGLLRTVPDGMEPDSDIAIMSILGYNPRKYHTGRGPLEAAGLGVQLGKNDIAFRCSLITEKKGLMEDYSAGHITTEEAKELMKKVEETYGYLGDFYSGVSYRHLFVMRNPPKGTERIRTTPPHKIVGEKLKDYMIKPSGMKIVETLNGMIMDSIKILSDHPVNIERVKNGSRPANAIWVWGQGKKPAMKSMAEEYGVKGAIISAVNLVKGLGVCAGMDKLEVPGATGYYDTSYENKAKFGLKALRDHDLVLIHVEAPDEAGHAGDVDNKIKAIENIDKRLVKKILEGMNGEYTISILSDHPTPLEVRGHVSDPVPFAIYSTGGHRDGVERFDEISARDGAYGVLEGTKFMGKLFRERKDAKGH